nr:MAG TPA: hypothetical protein [Caudoviricetes sp.]DAQ21144.1 MAG TPA: hypothetical protein [Caudoviricetes sp.]DAY44598.1 MAG TPA: hypothetical protein [Caudoviricetes sp.]DAZ07082.1 MAG TPA: hypothetical protein [Caudoviricetes sp.]
MPDWPPCRFGILFWGITNDRDTGLRNIHNP